MFMLYLDAGSRPGCMMIQIHHAEISLESEAYGDGFSLSPAGNIAAKAGCYTFIPKYKRVKVIKYPGKSWVDPQGINLVK